MTVAQGTPRTDAIKSYLRQKYPDPLGRVERLLYYIEAAETFGQECSMFEAENAALSAQVVELQKELAQLNHIRNLGSMFEPPAGEGTA